MILKIDEDKLPIKYILGVHESLQGYPDGFDILYEKIKTHVGQENKWNFTRHAVIRYLIKEGTDETKIDNSLQQLIDDGWIRTINETPGKESFKILKNPFE